MAWQRKRRRGWLCWTGVAACAMLAAVWCLMPRAHRHHFSDLDRGGNWNLQADTYDGRAVFSYEFRKSMTVGEMTARSEWSRPDEGLYGHFGAANLELGEGYGRLEVPIWVLGAGAAVLGLFPMTLRPRRVGPHRIRTAGVSVAVLSLTIAAASPFMNKLWRLHEVGRIAGSSVGFATSESGLWLWSGNEESSTPEALRTNRIQAKSYLEMLIQYEERSWGTLKWKRTGASRAFLANLSFSSSGFCVYNFAFVSWWVVGVLVAGPTMVACWRSRRVVAPGTCQGCGYDLSGLKSHGCPECGYGRVA